MRPGFVAAIADEVLTDYLEIVEAIEREIDRLDERALRQPGRRDVLAGSSGSAVASPSSAGRSPRTASRSRR